MDCMTCPPIAEEHLRASSLKNLRKSFTKRLNHSAGSACFEKWHFALLHRRMRSSDPLLPTLSRENSECAAQFLASELKAAGIGSTSSGIFAAWAEKRAIKAAEALAKKLKRTAKTKHRKRKKANDALNGGADAATSDGGQDDANDMGPYEVVSLAPSAKPGLVQVSSADISLLLQETHLQKLRRLFAHGESIPQDRKRRRCEDACANTDEPQFLRAVVALLLRYQALGGGGFQCALPSPVFECLEQNWGVECECFASPLNCHFGRGRFCSAFPDTDRPFGSLGTFESCDLSRGSYELNPPFSADLYAETIARLEQLLAEADKREDALSFILVVGATPAAMAHASMQRVQTSAFLRGHLLVAVQDHVYLSGQQHIKGRDSTFRACDTGVFFLQSQAGAARWPVTSANIASLRKAFAQHKGQPSR